MTEPVDWAERLEEIARACDEGARCFREANLGTPSAGAEQQAQYASDLRAAAAELRRLQERVEWFEKSGGVAAHTRVFQEIARAEQAEAEALAMKQRVVGAFDRWRQMLPVGAFSHSDGLRFVQMLTAALAATRPTEETSHE